MISNRQNYYSVRIVALAFFILMLMLGTFLYVGTQIIPSKLNHEVSQFCVHHLKDKSYQVKQMLLENVNNSKLWLKNRDNTFFDSKWFAISFYEHDGKEWVLKDFKMNNVVLDIYKIAQSEYIKVDQSLRAPNFSSDQITLQESKIGSMPVLVLDVPNNIVGYPKNHLIRITLFPDLFTSTFNSDEKCRLSLMDTKGNFLVEQNSLDKDSFLKSLQEETYISSAAEVSLSHFENKDVLNYKVLRNLSMLAFVKPHANIFSKAFIQIGVFNLITISIITLLILNVLFTKFQGRITAVNVNIRKVSHKDYHLQFDLSANDELSPTEEEVSLLADRLRKK